MISLLDHARLAPTVVRTSNTMTHKHLHSTQIDKCFFYSTWSGRWVLLVYGIKHVFLTCTVIIVFQNLIQCKVRNIGPKEVLENPTQHNKKAFDHDNFIGKNKVKC